MGVTFSKYNFDSSRLHELVKTVNKTDDLYNYNVFLKSSDLALQVENKAKGLMKFRNSLTYLGGEDFVYNKINPYKVQRQSLFVKVFKKIAKWIEAGKQKQRIKSAKSTTDASSLEQVLLRPDMPKIDEVIMSLLSIGIEHKQVIPTINKMVKDNEGIIAEDMLKAIEEVKAATTAAGRDVKVNKEIDALKEAEIVKETGQLLLFDVKA